MNFLFFKKLPDIARDTKEKVTQAFIKLKAEESNFFYKENLNTNTIKENLSSTYPSDVILGMKKVLAVIKKYNLYSFSFLINQLNNLQQN